MQTGAHNINICNRKIVFKGKNSKLKHHITRIIEDEMTYKHQQKQKLKKYIKRLSIQISVAYYDLLCFATQT